MDFFTKAKSVKLKSRHNKYLAADADEESVFQDRSESSGGAKWTVEFVYEAENVVRLKSCYGKYLTALDEEFLLGVTGRKVVQTLPAKLDSSVEWEPIRDGMQIKLKTRYGNYLRANGGPPPWRNSITHDIPHRHHDWILWDVEVVEIRSESDLSEEDLRCSNFRVRLPSNVSSSSSEDSPRKYEGRVIYYYVVDDDGSVNVDDSVEEGACFQLKGNRLEDLIQKLEEETGLEDIIVCCRNRVNGKLYPLRLALPPDNAPMHVFIVPSTSTAANEFMPGAPTSPSLAQDL
ncbi:hypothetical protein C2S52_002546 [Perilla frutescens var. hirtella]|uniref:DUF569 domain-containing protein n=1 Tax=Perilla frutescens var. hirtella TaxID=608512 RepID=A0AAD4P7X4_PERFH|nr:hypothetical protein C2S51_012893 [Perilla frutescens var. frutescens]KAH6792069.1 hypothetical protein C2S52_002546 [Perilla frutescens var. hirtella]KAH6830274.1 hypothetical protein C2S53_000243 [Perilla frutescens var. hirtella]